jgi:DNA repair protein RecN (Recombination protein N)
MTVITGETGAGKSIIVGALNLLFGKVAPQHIAYDASQDVLLEINFTVSPQFQELHSFLEENGFPADNNEVFIAREFSATGKSLSYLNGRKTSTAILKELHDLLIDFHHQRDQQNLLNTGFQLDLLDQFGDLLPLRAEFQTLLKELQTSITNLKSLQDKDAQNEQMLELYRFQLDELTSAGLIEGEDIALESEFDLLSHSEEIINISTQLYSSFYEQENSIYDSLTQAQVQLQKYIEMSDKIADVCNSLEAGIVNIQDASSALRILKEHIASDPERLNIVKSRLDLLNNLKTKYKKNTLEELLSYRQTLETEVNSQESNKQEILALQEKIDKLFTTLQDRADNLTQRRQDTAKKLSKEITENIKHLSLPNALLEIRIDKKTQEKILLTDISKAYTDCGQDLIEYRFSANPGSSLLPIKSIVSGGELSRILLAAKKTLSDVMPPRTMILDEIDVGIGGKTAEAMAIFIKNLSASYQVICITHLAKIAAAADNHLLIEKQSHKDSTSIEVIELTGDNRVKEIARMLSGNVTELSTDHAKELLNIDERYV